MRCLPLRSDLNMRVLEALLLTFHHVVSLPHEGETIIRLEPSLHSDGVSLRSRLLITFIS